MFSWDGVTFEVPTTWNLSVYKFIKKLTRVEFEDDYTIRLEAEWVRPKGELDVEKVQRRYKLQSQKLTKDAERVESLQDLPPGWVASKYSLAEEQQLVTAIFMEPDSRLFAFFIVYFEPEDKESPEAVIRTICETFVIQEGEIRRWQLYDIDLSTPIDFQLAGTDFQTGLKKMTFSWERRRFMIAFVNLADMVLRKHSKEEWLVRFLNSSRFARSGYFYLKEAGIEFRRRKRHKFGHIEELLRRCTLYKWGCMYDARMNLLIPWVVNYRKPSDMESLKAILINESQQIEV
ncbi:MAG: hypothetical protein O3B01_13825 [Planctomycetota bacterium]|nr:hypothetical protein [Planctomycetota bacterium]MDA1139647.1 hypothetical protein [Planctomycetota bacterium]